MPVPIKRKEMLRDELTMTNNRIKICKESIYSLEQNIPQELSLIKQQNDKLKEYEYIASIIENELIRQLQYNLSGNEFQRIDPNSHKALVNEAKKIQKNITALLDYIEEFSNIKN